MRLCHLLLASLVASTLGAQAPTPGTVLWGTKQRVEYVVGNSPLILTMPHGGYLSPGSIPDRTYGVLLRDARTQEVGQEIAAQFIEAYDLQPHLIISHLHRIKLDPNREIKEAAQGNPEAELAYKEFHAFIEQARRSVEANWGQGLLLDVHGHGHTLPHIELGYLLSAADLAKSDAQLNSGNAADKSSIRYLSRVGPTKDSFAALLRGPHSLGGLLESRGLPSVPAPKIPAPGQNPYFRGGYDVRRHGSQQAGRVDAVQSELPSSLRRDVRGRSRFCTALVQSLGSFFQRHYQRDLSQVALLGVRSLGLCAEEGGGYAELEIYRRGPLNAALAVSYQLGGSATAGVDYQHPGGLLVLPAGVDSRRILIRPLQDQLAEGTEHIELQLRAPARGPALAAANRARILILDDEADPGLAAHWPLDRVQLGRTDDSGPGTHHGTLQPAGRGPATVPGQLGGALGFDGVDDGVRIPDFTYTGSNGLTLTFWFKSSAHNGSSTQYLFSHGSVNAANSLNVYRYPGTQKLRTWLRCKTDIGEALQLDIEQDFMDDRWHHYLLTVTPGFGYAECYIDGALRARSMLGGDSLDPSGPIYLGCRQDLSSSRYFKGSLDDCRLIRRHLPVDEVRQLWRSGLGYGQAYGESCPTSGGYRATLAADGDLRPGGLLQLRLAGTGLRRAAILFFGPSRHQIAGAPLPLELVPLGAPGCWLYQDALLSAGLGLQNGGALLPLQLPTQASLGGVRLHAQAMMLDGQANQGGFVTTAGLRLVLGF